MTEPQHESFAASIFAHEPALPIAEIASIANAVSRIEALGEMACGHFDQDLVRLLKIAATLAANAAELARVARGDRDKYVNILCSVVGWSGQSRDDACGRIYFVQSTDSRLIKIGYSTNVQSRIASLQTGNGSKLKFLWETPGSMKDERALHQRFSSYREEGEWFRPTRELLVHIAKLRRRDRAAVAAAC